jgi:hypothetical protein
MVSLMVTAITAVIALMSLLMYILAERERIGKALEQIQQQQREKNQQRKALQEVARITSSGDPKQLSDLEFSLLVHIPLFLLAIISSSVLNFLEPAPDAWFIPYAVVTFASIAIIVIIILLQKSNKLELRLFGVLFFPGLVYSFVWGFFTRLLVLVPMEVFWAGIISGLVTFVGGILALQQALRNSRKILRN